MSAPSDAAQPQKVSSKVMSSNIFHSNMTCTIEVMVHHCLGLLVIQQRFLQTIVTDVNTANKYNLLFWHNAASCNAMYAIIYV